jgi:hypothetical protein
VTAAIQDALDINGFRDWLVGAAKGERLAYAENRTSLYNHVGTPDDVWWEHLPIADAARRAFESGHVVLYQKPFCGRTVSQAKGKPRLFDYVAVRTEVPL